MNSNHFLKRAYYVFLKYKSKFTNGHPVLVLMYHRINNQVGQKLAGLTVSVSDFEEQLLYYKQKFQILRLEENWTSLSKTGLVLTFDDGYADNFYNALPLLEKHNIPATIFVTTLNIDTPNEFWWDRLVFDYHAVNTFIQLPGTESRVLLKDCSYAHCVGIVSKLDASQREKWFLDFEKLNNILFENREEYRSLTIDELKALAKHPLITIGLHTHHHHDLSKLSAVEQKVALEFSITKLNEIIPNKLEYLAVPFGAYNNDTLIVADALGLKAILLANDYYSNQKNKESKKINRIIMTSIKGVDLENRIKKFDC